MLSVSPPSVAMPTPRIVPEREHEPHQAAGEPDLLRRHEVGDVSLERALREVRADLEQEVEADHRDELVAERDSRQEDDVEQRADHDVRLAASPLVTV